MSMNLVSYVGPYLEITGLVDSWYDLISDEKLCDLRGELYEGVDFLGLNTEHEGLLSFTIDPFNSYNPIDMSQIDIAKQKDIFKEFVKEEISVIGVNASSIEVCWGVVPGYF